jgi:hypothetical protein
MVCFLSLLTLFFVTGNTTVSAGSLKVTTPNGGESWSTGKKYTIKWKRANGGKNVKIELLRSGKVYKTISGKTKNDGSYSWKIPTTVATGSSYEIRVSPASGDKKDASNSNFSITETSSLKFSSSAFKNGGKIPEKYTCDGSEASPPFKISGVPSGAKELILFLDDLDGTPTATNTTTDWNHWVVTNISVKKPNFKNYRIPTRAKEGSNDSGDLTYEPICPPGEKGDREKHNYQFTLYAVDKKVTNNSSTRAQVKTAIDGSILQTKTLTAKVCF